MDSDLDIAVITEERADSGGAMAVLDRREQGAWPLQLRYLALGVYAETGSARAASRETGIPVATIEGWVKRDEEAISFLAELRTAVRTQTAHKLLAAAVLSVEVSLERLNNGNFAVDRRGQLMRVPVPLRDAVLAASIFIDKHALVTGALVGQKAATQLHGLADMLAKLMGQTKGLAPSVAAPTPEADGPVIG